MICSVEETDNDNEVELIVETEVMLKPEYRGLSATEIIRKTREKNTLKPGNKDDKSGESE